MPIETFADMTSAIQSDRTAASDYATDLLLQAQGVFDLLVDTVEDIDPNRDSMIGIGYVSAVPAPVLVEPNEPGELDAVVGVNNITDLAGEMPVAYVPADIAGINPVTIDAFAGELPELNLPVDVSGALPDAPTAPTINQVEVLTFTDVVIPPAPVLDAITIPVLPAMPTLPAFSFSSPVVELEAPSPVLAYNEATYTSELMTAAQARIMTLLQDGATGLPASVEQAIFDRAKTRELDEQRRNLVQTTDEFAAGGFPLPPGALRAKLASQRKEIQNRTEALSREVAIKQAELAQRNNEFAMDKALQAEGILREHFHRVADRALQVARATIEYAINVYNAKVSAMNLKLEQARLELAVYETQVKAAFQVVEYHKAELEAAKIRGDLRGQELQQYAMEIQGAEALLKMHSVRVEQVRATAELERMKADIFRSQIEGYTATVGAKEAEYRIYSAKVDAEKTKMQGFGARVDAYRALVQGKSTMIDAERSVMQSRIDQERAKIEGKRAEMDAYSSKASLVMAAINSAISEYQAKNDGYRSRIELATRRLTAEQFGATLAQQANQFNTDAFNRKLETQLRSMETLTNMKIQGGSAATNHSATIVASLLSQFVNILQTSGQLQKNE